MPTSSHEVEMPEVTDPAILARIKQTMPAQQSGGPIVSPTPRVDPLAAQRNAREQAKFDREVAKEDKQPQLTPAQKAVDTGFATEYVDWTTGGRSDFEKSRSQMAEALTSLEKGDSITGPFVGRLPDVVNEWVNPDAISTREAVEEVVQRNLRLILGAQFTEKEGERLIARAYNPRLQESENKRRLKRLMKQLEGAAQAKNDAAQYYEEHGTLSGWNGTLPSLSDFDPAQDAPAKKPAAKSDGWGKATVVD